MSLQWLTKVNDFLEQVPSGIQAYFDAIIDMGENMVQSQVDAVCRYAAWRVNIMVERARQRVLKGLYNQNKIVKGIIDTINLGKRFMQDPLGTVASFFTPLTSPLQNAIQFTIDLAREISRLAANLTKIAEALPPAPPSPRINYDEFKNNLRLGVVSMGALMDAESLPDPDILFPEPPFPFSRTTFNESFEEGKKSFTDNENIDEVNKNMRRVFYSPKGKTAMEGEIA